MAAVAQKIRTGLLELRTEAGPAYASPSFCQRLYLLWTFRNFHRLPQQVLNGRQRRLIEKLGQGAVLSRPGSMAAAPVIGVIENAKLTPSRSVQTGAARKKLIEISTQNADVGLSRAAGFGRAVTRWVRQARSTPLVKQVEEQVTKVREISSLKSNPAGPGDIGVTKLALVSSEQGKTWSGRAWIGATAVALVLLGVVFYFRGGRAQPSVAISRTALEAHPVTATSTPETTVPQPAPQQSRTTRDKQPDITLAAAKSPLDTAMPKAPLPKHSETALLPAETPSAAADSSAQPRLQVTEAPESGFTYPVSPNPGLTGKVSLQAVIGADGAVREVNVISGNRALAGAAALAVRHWRYRPPEVNGHAVEAETKVTISFLGDEAVTISFPTAQ